ncbi:MAG: ATP-binding cassette domain-containing protein, partial [Beijerinckiaceae bacterium]|nr:ATP-binding cassette domain-containing protein [Beijerinckiaceae bacterium]
MAMFKIYLRALAQLGPEKTLGFCLGFANILIAAAAFAEPVLFGRIIDMLTTAQGTGVPVNNEKLIPLIAMWIGFGLFTIAGGVLIALYAERLSHRRRLAVMANYFEHVLNLPQAFHTQSHSGALMKVMLEGANGLGGMTLSFFREHLASLVTLFVMLPLSLYINWRLALLLVLLVFIFTILSAFILRKTETLQGDVEAFHTQLAERATDSLGNISVIQSFTRIADESAAMRKTIDRLLSAQIPVLSWWAVAAVVTRASATLTILGILLLGTWLFSQGFATVGEVVTFMAFATALIGRLDQVVGFINAIFLQAPKLKQFFDVIDTVPAVRDKPDAKDPGRLSGKIAFHNVSFSYDGKKPAVADVTFEVQPGETIALVGSTGSGKSTTLGLLHRVFDPQSGYVSIDDIDIRDIPLASLRANIGVVFQEPMLFARSIEENVLVGNPQASPDALGSALERAQAADFVARQPEGVRTVVGERGRTLSGGERQRRGVELGRDVVAVDRDQADRARLAEHAQPLDDARLA